MAAPKRKNDNETYYSLKVKSTDDVLNSISRICNMCINDRLDNQTCNTLNNLLKTALQALRLGELEDEVERLRDLLENIEKGED